eukprot:50374_1
MLLCAIIAVFILTSIWVIHYFHHFTFVLCEYKYNAMSKSDSKITKIDMKHIRMQRTISTDFESIPKQISILQLGTDRTKLQKKRKCLCKLEALNGESFNFFPLSFTIYIMFLISLCILIIINEAIQNSVNSSQILYQFSIKSYHENSMNSINSLNLNNNTNLVIYIIDYILLYGVMITLIWQSLFNFFRYYTTLKTATNLEVISTNTVLKLFILYAIPFSVIYLLQIHVYYFIFPFVILLHFSCNLYWTLKFASILINQYRVFEDLDSSIMQKNADQDVLNSVFFMRKTSLICCVLQTTYLSLLVVTYNVNTIYYLPIFWSISCLIFACNFVRNRKGVIDKCFKCKKLCIKNNEIKTNQNMNNTMKLHIHTTSTGVSNEIIDVIEYKAVETNPGINPMSPIKEETSNACALNTSNTDSNHKLKVAISIGNANSAPTITYQSKQLNLEEQISTPILKMHNCENNTPQIQPNTEDESHHHPYSFPFEKQRNNTPDLDRNSNLSAPTLIDVIKKNDLFKIPDARTGFEKDKKEVNDDMMFIFIDGTDSEHELDEIDDDNNSVNDNEDKFEESLNIDERDNDTKCGVDDELYMDDVVKSFNILVSYGFCSKMHVNSLNQMKACYNSINKTRLGHAHTIHGSGKDLFKSTKMVHKKLKTASKANTMRKGMATKSFLSLFNK